MDIFDPHPKKKRRFSSSPSALRRQIERDAMRDMFPSHPGRKPIRRIKKSRID